VSAVAKCFAGIVAVDVWSQADSLRTWSMDFCGASELAEIEIELRAPPSPARRRLKTGDMGGLERVVTLKSLA
jgi:hypothetical protein